MKGARLLLIAAALSGAVAATPGRSIAALWKPKEPSKPAVPPKGTPAAKASKPSAKTSRDQPAVKAKAPAKGATASRHAAAPKGKQASGKQASAMPTKGKPTSGKLASGKAAPGKAAEPAPAAAKVAGAKIAVFAFHGDGVEPVRRQVLRLLRSKGMKVNATLRPVDSAEQYREMATALGLVAYLDGEVNGDGPDASATVHVRSGHTGLRMASATFSGDRRALPGTVGRELWPQVGGALGRACADASKPRRGGRAPMRINAGTPLADSPPPDPPAGDPWRN